MLLIIWNCLYIKAMLFIRMANYLSLYIKKRHLSSCTSSLFSSKTHYQELCLGRVEPLCASQHGKEKFQKLKTRFFLRLRNLGFLKYVLTKLFRNVTYSQRNKLLKIESPLPNVCQPLTIQEAERMIILQEGVAMLALSKEDGASTLTAVQTQTCSMPKNTAGTSLHQGIPSTEGLNSLPASCSTISY